MYLIVWTKLQYMLKIPLVATAACSLCNLLCAINAIHGYVKSIYCLMFGGREKKEKED